MGAEEPRQPALYYRLWPGGAGAARAPLDADLPRTGGDPVHEAEQLTRLVRSGPQRSPH